MRNWLRDRGIGAFFVSVFIVTWAGRPVLDWLDYSNEEKAHGADPFAAVLRADADGELRRGLGVRSRT